MLCRADVAQLVVLFTVSCFMYWQRCRIFEHPPSGNRRDRRRTFVCVTSTTVLLKTDEHSNWRRSGVITDANRATRSYTIATPTGLLRRNRKHIIPAAPAATTSPAVSASDTLRTLPSGPEPNEAAPEPSPTQDAPAAAAGPTTRQERQSPAADPGSSTSGRPKRNRRAPTHLDDYVR